MRNGTHGADVNDAFIVADQLTGRIAGQSAHYVYKNLTPVIIYLRAEY
jgi:hypothetical protein